MTTLWVILALALVCATSPATSPPTSATTSAAAPTVERYARFEASAQSGPVAGNPFDGDENPIAMIVTSPKGDVVEIPAFYDGGTTWRARFTPSRVGRHRYRFVARGKTRLAAEVAGEFRVVSSARTGFVRIDRRRPGRFAVERGGLLYPMGRNVAWMARWEPNAVDFDRHFDAMASGGENWARVWMASWGGLNLEWTPGKLGEYDLEAARYLDRVFGWAEERGIRIQLVLQHHGQFSTHVNPNWADNPLNRAKGGFLDAPGDFFTDAKARDLFKRRAAYIVARWGYSPHLFAWELFNEVQFTDGPDWSAVARWHDEMATFIRSRDPYHHPITTSSPPFDSPVWNSMDFVQEHRYSDDPFVAAASTDGAGSKPAFVGEWGAVNGEGPARDTGAYLRRGLWAGIFSGAAGGPMFWAWDYVQAKRLDPVIAAAVRFARSSGIATRSDLKPVAPRVESDCLGSLTVSPGLGWEVSTESEFKVSASTGVLGRMPSFIQGRAHPERMPRPPTLIVGWPCASRAVVSIAQNSGSGSEAVLLIDGVEVARRTLPPGTPGPGKRVDLTVDLPAGRHRLTIVNQGDDWFRVDRVAFEGAAPRLKVVSLAGRNHAVIWVRNGDPSHGPVSGRVRISGMNPGDYILERYDVVTGSRVSEAEMTVEADGFEFSVEALEQEAGYVLRGR